MGNGPWWCTDCKKPHLSDTLWELAILNEVKSMSGDKMTSCKRVAGSSFTPCDNPKPPALVAAVKKRVFI